MVKILNCYLYAKKSYGILSKGAIFFGQPCISEITTVLILNPGVLHELIIEAESNCCCLD